MSNKVFKVVLLQALPASGKSEVRNFMAHVEPERLRDEFHIGANLQLDDFPYVHMMRRIDNELEAMGQARIFYPGEAPFVDGRDWGTLCALLNEDYHDLMNRVRVSPDSAAQYLFDRIDRAGQIAGIAPRLSLLDEEVRAKVAEKLEAEARAMLDEKQAAYPESFEGKTVVIECARGGPDGASMPLTDTFGYQYSLPFFCPEILENAAILYIWVTPWPSCWATTAATIWSICAQTPGQTASASRRTESTGTCPSVCLTTAWTKPASSAPSRKPGTGTRSPK